MLPGTHIENTTRRSFVSRAAAGIAAFGLFGGVPRAAEAQLVWKTSEWGLGEFQKLVNEPARVKQVYDVVQISDGKVLNSVKNSLNGLRFGFGIPRHSDQDRGWIARRRQHAQLRRLCLGQVP